jgi:hypothetical protein
MPITARNFKKEIGIDFRLPIEDVAQGSPFLALRLFHFL